MKKKGKINLILLIFAFIFISSSSITPQTVAQESINITMHGCSLCNQENNDYIINWTWTGTIPLVSIFIYNIAWTTLEYTVADGITNIGSYNWSFPVSHPLDGQYNLIVCDYSNHNVNDSIQREIYPIQTLQSSSPKIPGYPMLSIGLIVGIISVIVAIPLTKKLRKK